MNVEQIKQAINEGKKVYWSNEAYPVIKDGIDQYLIKCSINECCILLTWRNNGVTLNGEESDFFIG